MKICPACGTQNTDTANFCIGCGVDLTATATEQKLHTDSAVDIPPGYLDNAPSSLPAASSTGAEVPPDYLNSPPAPPPTYTSSPSPSFSASASTPAYTSAASTKDRTLALVLEVLPGLIGFLGIGWFYAGNPTAGLVGLIGFWVGNIVAVVLDFISLGCFVLPHIALAIATILISTFTLYNYTKQHPELFGS